MMRQFSGHNRLNNCVSIDYVSGVVDFRPVPDSWSGSYVAFLLSSWAFVVLLYFVFWILLLLFVSLFFSDVIMWVFGVFLVLLCCSVVLGFLFSLLFFNVYFADFLFPKVNAFWSSFWSFLFSGRFREWRVVDSASIIDCMIIIPSFSNVRLEYEAVGDFSKYLIKVLVRNHFVDDDGSWFAVFMFSEHPKGGFLRVSYD